jgi:hypothetical protein
MKRASLAAAFAVSMICGPSSTGVATDRKPFDEARAAEERAREPREPEPPAGPEHEEARRRRRPMPPRRPG